jgi:hypothetical protein
LLKRPIPVKQQLDQVFIYLLHLVNRYTNCTLCLDLECNGLSSNVQALTNFLIQCSRAGIAEHITEINFDSNNLPYIPRELKEFSHLRRVRFADNKFTEDDVAFLMSEFKELEEVMFSGNSFNYTNVFHMVHNADSPIKIFLAQTETSKAEYYCLEQAALAAGNYIPFVHNLKVID